MILIINVKRHSKNDALSLTPVYVFSEPELQALLFFSLVAVCFLCLSFNHRLSL